MKVLVTGALGNVGRYTIHSLLEMGQQVAAADIDTDKLNRAYEGDPNVICAYFDFTKPETFDRALEGADRVFLMRPPHLGKPSDLQPFIDAMKKKGNIRLVSFLSLIGVENNPVPPHHKIEKLIERAGLVYCHIRPSFFMQNLSGVHSFEIKHFNRIVVPAGKSRTSFIDAKDIGAVAAKALSEPEKHQNRSYEITGPQAIDYVEAAKILSEELGRNITYADPKPSLAQKYWTQVRGLEKGYSTVMGLLYMMTRMGAAKKVTGVFEAVMGKKPRTFRQFVQENADAWR